MQPLHDHPAQVLQESRNLVDAHVWRLHKRKQMPLVLGVLHSPGFISFRMRYTSL